MSEQFPESTGGRIDVFIDMFFTFDARLVARADPEVHIPISDKIAMFAIFMSHKR